MSINSFFDLKYIINYSDHQIVSYLSKNEVEYSEIVKNICQAHVGEIAFAGHIQSLRFFLYHDIDVNCCIQEDLCMEEFIESGFDKSEKSPLFCAVIGRNRNCSNALIKFGADLEKGDNCETPLNAAIRIGDYDIFEDLIKAGANHHMPDDAGHCAIYYAATYGRVFCLIDLIKKGCNVNREDRSTGFAPIISASLNGHAYCVLELIKYGADVNATDDRGRSAYYFARNNEHHNCAIVLLHCNIVTNEKPFPVRPIFQLKFKIIQFINKEKIKIPSNYPPYLLKYNFPRNLN